MPRLIDADALVKRIEETKRDWNEKKAIYSWNYAYDSFIDDIDKQPTVGGWISVKDRLPEPEEKVLIYTKTGCLKYAQYHYEPNVVNPWYVYEDQARAWTNVISHWMPLPEPPKEEEE